MWYNYGMKTTLESGVVLGLTLMVATCQAGATFLLAGDSTLDDYGRKSRGPYASWGTTLEKSMKPGCKVDNYARSGASTKSFIASGQWEKLVAAIKPGDFVGIQFGHNDQKWSTPFYVEKRFADLKRVLKLDDLEAEILMLAYVKDQTCFDWPCRVEDREKPLYYAMALDRSYDEIVKAMSPQVSS